MNVAALFGISFELWRRRDFIPGQKVFKCRIDSGGFLLIDGTANRASKWAGEVLHCFHVVVVYPSRLEFRDHKLMKLSRSSHDVYEPTVPLLRRITRFSWLSTGIRCTVNHINHPSIKSYANAIDRGFSVGICTTCYYSSYSYKEIYTNVLLDVDEF